MFKTVLCDVIFDHNYFFQTSPRIKGKRVRIMSESNSDSEPSSDTDQKEAKGRKISSPILVPDPALNTSGGGDILDTDTAIIFDGVQPSASDSDEDISPVKQRRARVSIDSESDDCETTTDATKSDTTKNTKSLRSCREQDEPPCLETDTVVTETHLSADDTDSCSEYSSESTDDDDEDKVCDTRVRTGKLKKKKARDKLFEHFRDVRNRKLFKNS